MTERRIKIERAPEGWPGGKGWRWMVMRGDEGLAGTERFYLTAWLRAALAWRSQK